MWEKQLQLYEYKWRYLTKDVDKIAPGKTGSSTGPISKRYKINISTDVFSFNWLNTELLALCHSFMYSTPLSQVPVPGHWGAWQKVVSCRGPWQSLPPWADAGWEQALVRVFSPKPPQDREQELQELQGDNPPCTGQCCREQFHLPCSQPLQGMHGKLTISKLGSVPDAKDIVRLQIFCRYTRNLQLGHQEKMCNSHVCASHMFILT